MHILHLNAESDLCFLGLFLFSQMRIPSIFSDCCTLNYVCCSVAEDQVYEGDGQVEAGHGGQLSAGNASVQGNNVLNTNISIARNT